MVAAKYKTMTKQLQAEKKDLLASAEAAADFADSQALQLAKADEDNREKADALTELLAEKKRTSKKLVDIEHANLESNSLITEIHAFTGGEGTDGATIGVQILDWCRAQKRDKEAVRMFGELQIEHNLLKEKLADIHLNGHKVSKSKSKKGLSTTHRAEDIQNGVLRCFQKDRCCAVAWAEGKGQQCSRHWDKNKDADGRPVGKTSKLCKTHQKFLKADGTYEGSFGLYQKQRPTKWGECGLTHQLGSGHKKDGKINWKMTELDYDRQFATEEFQSSIPSDLPKYLFPDEDAPQTSSDEEMEVSDDESEGEGEHDISADDEVSSDEEEEEEMDCGIVAVGGVLNNNHPVVQQALADLGGPAPAPLLSEESEDEMGEMVDEQAELEAEIEANGCAESDDESECELEYDDESE